MKKLKLLPIIIAAGLLGFSCNDDDEKKPDTQTIDDCLTTNSSISGTAIDGEYIVSFGTPDTNGRIASVETVFGENDIPTENLISSIAGEQSMYLLKLTKDAAEKLKNDSRITAVEPDRIISICGCFTVVEPKSVTWNAEKVGYGDGTGKTAWIIDTGIDSDHPDLNVDLERSRSFMPDVSSYEDDNGHGTHIAGIIGALNNDIGTLGVASGASMIALKVLDENGDGKLSSLLNALAYVKSNGKAGDVINISVGFEEVSDILETEIKAIANKGIYFTLAAGNNSAPASGYSPARIGGKNIYTVTAVDSTNTFADFSNFGNDVVDYAAPGVQILSTYTEGKYAILSGTSMAAPHVAGLLLINDGTINSSGSAIADPDGVADPLAHQ
jgi:subtilisin